MLSFIWPLHTAAHQTATFLLAILAVWLLLFSATTAHGMTDDLLQSLRKETIDLFYHGFDNYMTHAFPEDELKPLLCKPLTRDRENPAHIELNDVLGNYSLTLIDSLSTLAILASSPELAYSARDPLADFQRGVESLVQLYGDGSPGPAGQGSRSKGFDLDSKVQVFETIIRGVGGLLSAHLFAIGDLPIIQRNNLRTTKPLAQQSWPNGFRYDGQLLRLAEDLAKRLVPAFYTDTGLPYPRVNLRHGVPFYLNSPLNADAEHGFCQKEAPATAEITETCSAGAGSLVLEFTTLSRLTHNPLYENLAKSAFWAVWHRRSEIDLIGTGIDAESGAWVSSHTHIGAGVDSFFEYALKSHILLSGSSPTSESDSDASDFLQVWEDAHSGIKRHLYRGPPYYSPHYIQGDLFTGAPRSFWIDSLSAYYPGLLTLAGELDEAIETHMLFTALWNRYSALPERWSSANGAVEAGLRWWGGRPEFIESTWYLYQATKDPWYLFVAQMTLDDIKRRCWTACGWAGLEDVRTGELKDRMESFFLGETAKYLYLLFDPSHPLNKLDASFVFTTEGHPLLLPKSNRIPPERSTKSQHGSQTASSKPAATCPAPPPPRPLTISNAVSRLNYFHAASLARLHQIPSGGTSNSTAIESSYTSQTLADTVTRSPSNFTFYPWTLPNQYIPSDGTSSILLNKVSFDLSFPSLPNTSPGPRSLKQIDSGVLVNSISGLTMELVKELILDADSGSAEAFRVAKVGPVVLGKDETVFVASEAITSLSPVDPYFTRHHEAGTVDLVIDVLDTPSSNSNKAEGHLDPMLAETATNLSLNLTSLPISNEKDQAGLLQLLLQQISSGQNSLSALFQGALQTSSPAPNAPDNLDRPIIPAAVATGLGSVPLPAISDISIVRKDKLPWTKIYVLEDVLCNHRLPVETPRDYQVIVVKRGGCSFSQKLENVPPFAPSATSLQLFIVVSYPEQDEAGEYPRLIRPHLDGHQLTPGGLKRANQIAMVLVEGGDTTMHTFKNAKAVGYRKRYHYESQGHRIVNLELV